MGELIEVEDKGAVRRLTLNRPETHNALSGELLSELQDALEAGTDDTSVSVFIVRGAGRSFSSGFDLGTSSADRRKAMETDPWRGRDLLRRLTRHHEAVWQCPLPVVAAVHGNCLAGGADLALHCDFMFVANDARIGYPPVRNLGAAPTNLWLYRIGAQQAKRLLLTGDLVSGKEAVEIGLAMQACSVEDLDDVTMAFAQRMALIDRNLLISNKTVVNRGIDLMGRMMLNRIAESEDALGHTSAAAREFGAIATEHGLREAIRRRDAPFAK